MKPSLKRTYRTFIWKVGGTLFRSNRFAKFVFLIWMGLLPSSLVALQIDNDVYRTSGITGEEIVVNGRSELHVTGTGDPVTGSIIKLNSPDAWLFFPNIAPSSVSTNLLSRVRVGNTQAVLDVNVRVVQHVLGTVVIPHGPDFPSLEIYHGSQFTGRRDTVESYRVVEPDSLTGVRSFRLRRGYMATFAKNEDGTGVSRCYVAQDADLEISSLPEGLAGSVRFLRVFPWRWVAKKGVCGNIEQGLDVKWTYNWNLNRNSPLDWEYVPIRQTRWWPGLGENWKNRGANHLLGYNEPDRPDQANMTVAEAIAGWPLLLGTGLRVGAPAVSDGGLNWLYSFMDQADAAGLRVDFVPIHYYRSHSNPANASGAATQFYNFLKGVHDRVKRPLWVTEWNNGANWSSDPDPTPAQQAAAVAAMTDMLDNAPFVERYAIYNWVEDVRRVKWDDGSLTSAGVVYRDNASPLAYLQEMPAPSSGPVANYAFDGNFRDISGNGHEASVIGTPSFTAGKSGKSLFLDGVDDSLRLPQNLGDSTDFSFAAWVKWDGGGNWQRIFDLGNGSADFICLTPKSSSNQMRFTIRKGGVDQFVSATALVPGVWSHVAVTLGGNTGRIYVNGGLAASNVSMSYNPVDLATRFNHIGRGQFDADPSFAGCIDDARFFDHEMSAAQVAAIAGDATPPQFPSEGLQSLSAVKHLRFNGSIADGVVGGAKLRFRKIAGPAWLTVAPDGRMGGVPGASDGGRNIFLMSVANENGSADTAELEILVKQPDELEVRYAFDGSASASAGMVHAVAQGGPLFVTGRRGNSILLDGADDHLVLPPGTGSHESVTFAAWVYWNGGGDWQRLFDLGNGQDEHVFITPRSGNGRLRFSLENNNVAHFIEGPSPVPTGTWVHLAATLGEGQGKIYMNGSQVASGPMSGSPSDFNPSLNYIGRSRFASDPFFSGRVDEAMIFPRSLTGAEIAGLAASRAPELSGNPITFPPAYPGQPYARGTGSIASDPDEGDSLTFRKVGGPSWLAISEEGIVSGIPSEADAGMNRFLMRVTDNRLLATDVEIRIAVVQPASSISHLQFDGGPNDAAGAENITIHGGAVYTPAAFDRALNLDGVDDHAVLRPGILDEVSEVTISAVVKWDGGTAWQRIFDFGNNTDQFACLTPYAGNGSRGLRFTIKNGGAEQQLNDTQPLPAGEWSHVAVTLAGNTGTLYLNGTVVDTKTISIGPRDFKPSLNYIGKSLFASDPYFRGQVDDFRIFSRALSAEEVEVLAMPISSAAVSDAAYVYWAAGFSFLPGEGEPQDDPDNDGLVNLLEYLLGSDPLVSGSESRPVARLEHHGGNQYLHLAARVRKNRPGVTLIPQAASTPEGLLSPDSHMHVVPWGDPQDEGEFEILTWYYDVPVGASSGNHGFMRLKVVMD